MNRRATRTKPTGILALSSNKSKCRLGEDMNRSFLEKIQAPVPKQTQVYDLLKQALIEARFEPGEVVSIRALAASFGTSTMPVREAASRLITERALEALPNRGLRVPTLTKAEALDILRVRAVLEGTAASLAAKEITAAEIRELERYEVELENAVKKKRLPESVQLNLKFHLGVCRASRSETLVSLIESLYLRAAPRVHRSTRLIPGDAAHQTQYVRTRHAAILDALRRADSKGAQQAIEADISDVMNLEALPDPAAQQPEPTAQKRSRRTVASSTKSVKSRTGSRRAGGRG
jgi:DNA-binding GntR family transcriptional regulator